MKQVKMILKAQKVHFELHNSTQHRYKVDMTNDGHTSSTGAQGTLLWVCHLGACRSSYQLRICVVLSCGVERGPPELSESPLLASFDSNEHLDETFYVYLSISYFSGIHLETNSVKWISLRHPITIPNQVAS